MKNKRILFFVFGMVLFLAFAKLLFANMLSTTGLRLANLSEQVSAVSAENSLLEEEIVKFSSLSRISSEAANLGFGKPSLVVNLTPEVPVALR
ncbi:MAG: hypothetical protein ACOZBZ_04160 [Patescibacteria group bacterium]